MTFSSALDLLNADGRGVHAYQLFSRTARDRARMEKSRAAAWLMLAALTDWFAQRSFEEPLLESESNAQFEEIAGLAGILDRAYGEGGDVLLGLNEAALALFAIRSQPRRA